MCDMMKELNNIFEVLLSSFVISAYMRNCLLNETYFPLDF